MALFFLFSAPTNLICESKNKMHERVFKFIEESPR